jgi:hypothetical protein
MSLLTINKSLGGIWTLNLPAILSCPGSTESCRSICYGCKGNFRYEHVRKAHVRNLRELQEELDAGGTDGLARRLTRELLMAGAGPVRIHSSGDFFCIEYLLALALAIRAIREDFGVDLVCYAYSRTWRLGRKWIDAWVEAVEIGDGGLWIWASTDAETGDPWEKVGWPLCADICGVTPGVGDEMNNCLKQILHVPNQRNVPPERGCHGCRRCFHMNSLVKSEGTDLPLRVAFLRH